MWSTYLIFIYILGARETFSERNLNKRQIYYPIPPNVYGYPFQHSFPQVLFPPAYYQPNEYAYRMLMLTPETTHESTTKSFISSRDNFNSLGDKISLSARKSSNPVIIEKKEQKIETNSTGKSGDDKINTNMTIVTKMDDGGNDTLATGARLEVEISSDNSTDTAKTKIDNKNSTAS